MSLRVNTKDVVAVSREVQMAYLQMFVDANPAFVPSVFAWASDCFQGQYRDYQAIDARYHDFEHTLQGTLCFARLLHGYVDAGIQPRLTQRSFELGLLAILLHDTGYLKRQGDNEGTGAKYTLTHVQRSVDFAENLLVERGFPAEEIKSVQNMIRCTGVNVILSSIPFANPVEERVGFALGTADLLGQMAADDYVDKLEILYEEFAESAAFNGGRYSNAGMFSSADDLKSKTPVFWDNYVVPKIDKDFLGLYRYLGRPSSSTENYYIQKIRANMLRLRPALTARAA